MKIYIYTALAIAFLIIAGKLLALQDYKEIMQSIADSNLLESILRELSGNPDYTFEKVQTGLQVTSDYCICS